MQKRNLKRFLGKFLRQPLYGFKVFIRRLKGYASYHFGEGGALLPEAITLFLTHRCNLRCKMCGQWGESGVTKRMDKDYIREELDFSQYKELVDELAKFKPNITLFGGEPLLYSHCLELIKYIKHKGMHCLMISNGSLFNQYAGEIVNSKLDELNVSLDGKKELHDEIRGMSGLFEKITSGLKRIRQFKKKIKAKKPLVNLQCTITKYNYHHLEGLIDVAYEVGADSLTFHNLIFLGQDLIEKQKEIDKKLGFSSKEWEGFVFEPQINVDELYKKIKSILSKKFPFSVDFYPNFSLRGLREYYNNPSYLPSEYKPRCISPWIVAYIFPDGEVRPCLNFSYSFGNVKKESFLKVWNSHQAVNFRKFLKERKIFPVCVRCTELYRY